MTQIKVLKISAFIFLVTMLLFSCQLQEPEPSTPYYKFTKEDQKLILPNQKIGSRYFFKSNLNNEIIYEIVKEKTLKRGHTVGMATFLGSVARFHYDERTISWRPNNGCNCDSWDIEYTFIRRPLDYEKAEKSESPKPLASRMDLYMDFPQWTGTGSYNIYINVNKVKGRTFSKYGKEYNDVFIVDTNRDKSVIEDRGLFNIDIIYYDAYTGVIGFTNVKEEEYWLYKVE